MTLYLDVAGVRIQSYLARTPTLRGRRVASAVLAHATRFPGADGQRGEGAGAEPSGPDPFADIAVHNDEAGVADGVVNLVLRDGVRPEDAARRVFTHLRGALPGAEFQAVWGEGDSYLQAYQQEMRPRLEAGGDQVMVDLPAVAEFPPVVPCRYCRSAAAVGRVRLAAEEPEQDACADCTMRYGDRQAGRLGRTAEDRLADTLDKRRPREFASLAGLGSAGRGRNHLATVYADGNAIGDFFDALAQRPGTSKTRVSRELSETTWSALVAAARAVQADHDEWLGTVPHVVGGDDVLVSVPAERGWQFVLVLLEHMQATMSAMAEREGLQHAPSVSAGLVFSRADHPFHEVVEEAGACLRRAKSRTGGQAASIDFLDSTVEGRTAPDEPPLRLETLLRHRAPLDALAAVAGSRRTRLGALLRGSDGVRRARGELRRLGMEPAAEAFLPRRQSEDPGGTPDHSDPDGITLRQALRIARWWPRG